MTTVSKRGLLIFSLEIICSNKMFNKCFASTTTLNWYCDSHFNAQRTDLSGSLGRSFGPR